MSNNRRNWLLVLGLVAILIVAAYLLYVSGSLRSFGEEQVQSQNDKNEDQGNAAKTMSKQEFCDSIEDGNDKSPAVFGTFCSK